MAASWPFSSFFTKYTSPEVPRPISFTTKYLFMNLIHTVCSCDASIRVLFYKEVASFNPRKMQQSNVGISARVITAPSMYVCMFAPVSSGQPGADEFIRGGHTLGGITE